MFPEENKRNERKFDISDRSSLAILGSFLDSWAARRCLWFLLQVIPRPRNNCLRPSPVVQPLHLREPANSRGFTIEPSFSSLASRFMFLCSVRSLSRAARANASRWNVVFIHRNTRMYAHTRRGINRAVERKSRVLWGWNNSHVSTCGWIGMWGHRDRGLFEFRAEGHWKRWKRRTINASDIFGYFRNQKLPVKLFLRRGEFVVFWKLECWSIEDKCRNCRIDM